MKNGSTKLLKELEYFAEMPNEELRRARHSMAIISVNLYEKEPRVGGAVIIDYMNNRYLITASHSTGETAYGRSSDHIVYKRRGRSVRLRDLRMKYSVPMAIDAGLPIADIAIFAFPFETESVRLAQLPDKQINAVSIGFPVDAIEYWKRSRLPVARSGKAYVTKRTQREFVPYGIMDPETIVPEITHEAKTAGGASGGGLFTEDGKLLAICRGYKSERPEFGEFHTIRDIFKALNL